MLQVKKLFFWGHKFTTRRLLLAGATTLLASLAFVSTVHAGVTISITPPVCQYGYYGYAPYGCAPSGYYGPGYFYGGVFLGVGPWANWGYGHGWGSHRFSSGGGGSYRGVGGHEGGRAPAVVRTGHSNAATHESHATATRAAASHSNSHAAPARGGASHGAESHGGGDKH
jgi:hypothetical protein